MDLDDIPTVVNKWLFGDVLRGEMGFSGWVVSDANGMKNQVGQHFVRDDAEAAVRAIAVGNAGLGAAPHPDREVQDGAVRKFLCR